ncbi:hypothetical protein BpHYR1_028407 [Brachionus plicatilis]|uniref:Uncharacterized protein n=1 Tax=Brachionus plicatilis TaxID=10195 RepID=A0A3M7P6U6_BRAPC|nr:hypothetical protein BpHYR1_028407 [Brachionus plicatilis]
MKQLELRMKFYLVKKDRSFNLRSILVPKYINPSFPGHSKDTLFDFWIWQIFWRKMYDNL